MTQISRRGLLNGLFATAAIVQFSDIPFEAMAKDAELRLIDAGNGWMQFYQKVAFNEKEYIFTGFVKGDYNKVELVVDEDFNINFEFADNSDQPRTIELAKLGLHYDKRNPTLDEFIEEQKAIDRALGTRASPPR